MNLYDPVYQRELRERVLQKIIDDWSVHFSHHGAEYVNLNAIKSQNRFVEDVADVIEKTVAAQLGTTEASQIGLN